MATYWEHGWENNAITVGTNCDEAMDNVGGYIPITVSDSVYKGTYAMECQTDGTTGAEYIRFNNEDSANPSTSGLLASGQNVLVGRIHFRVESQPTAASLQLMKNWTTPFYQFNLFVTTSNGVTFHNGSTESGSEATVTTGQWHCIDWRINASSNPITFDWQFDEVAKTQRTISDTGTRVDSFILGSVNYVSVTTVQFDEIAFSSTAGDYPLGPSSLQTPPYINVTIS